jgi:hypothetical protein
MPPTPTRPSWPLRAPARPTPPAPLTTARPGPRWNASSPIWSAAATAAAASGSAGLAKVAADFSLLAAAVNLARLGVLGLHWTGSHGWAAA